MGKWTEVGERFAPIEDRKHHMSGELPCREKDLARGNPKGRDWGKHKGGKLPGLESGF